MPHGTVWELTLPCTTVHVIEFIMKRRFSQYCAYIHSKLHEGGAQLYEECLLPIIIARILRALCSWVSSTPIPPARGYSSSQLR